MKNLLLRYPFPLALAASALLLAWSWARGQLLMVLITAMVLISAFYLLGLARLWRSAGFGHGIPAWRAACFLGGMLMLALSLSGPVDELTDHSFSAHMVQHVILMKVVTPLLLLGEFTSLFLWAMGRPAARRLTEVWGRSTRLKRVWTALTHPCAAWTLFAVCLWSWHIPSFYQAALEDEFFHDLEHLLFLVTSLLFWWYLLQKGREPAVRYGTAVLYLFTTLLHESTLGALLTFSTHTWYSFYSAPDPWGLSPLADQQLAGVIMWLPGGVLFMLLIILYFGAWLRAIETRMQRTSGGLVRLGDRNE